MTGTGNTVRARVRFERIRQNYDIPDLLVEADAEGTISELIHRYAGSYLGSSKFQVHIADDHGWLDAGIYNAGRFTIEAAD